METAAEKARRQIKAGRMPKTRAFPSLLSAILRICDEADRARSIMQKHGLDPNDIHLALIYRPAPGKIGSTALPAPGNTGAFIEKFEQMGNVDYLGILWWQTSPDNRGRCDVWITEFADDKQAANEMVIFKRLVTSGAALK
jgi:hypothetical protein